MIVEDDFPLCPGPTGGDAIRAVVHALESRRRRALCRSPPGLLEDDRKALGCADHSHLRGRGYAGWMDIDGAHDDDDDEMQDGQNESDWPRAGWVGTGGSGLIFHRSILPAAAHLLRSPPPTFTPSPSANSDSQHIREYLSSIIDLRPPPDVIMQNCILSKPGAVGCGADATGRPPNSRQKGPGAIISARLAMRHAGGDGNSALQHRTPGERWQCGWR